MSQDKDAATRTSNPGGLSQHQVELINSRKVSAAERQAGERAAQKDASSAARRAADAADRSSGRSLQLSSPGACAGIVAGCRAERMKR